jgi:NADH-quinone oxidoreductase subunit A
MEFLSNYLPILLFLAIALGLSLIMVGLPFLMARGRKDREKLSAYECGFESYQNARIPFDIKFYLVSILFIIFDLEVAFLFPWAISLKSIGEFGYWSMMLFLFILLLGFIYEWKKGALDWK